MLEGQQWLKTFGLEGQVAAITGGARGIGRAAAILFAAAGARVLILDRDATAAEETANHIVGSGGMAHPFEINVADEGSIEQVFALIKQQFGALHVLVNNAGIAIRRPSVELSLADWNAVVAINMTGVFLCARAAARAMIAHNVAGAIVNTASIMGMSGGGVYPNISYQTTKGAIVNMTRALAVEWSVNRIRVNAVAPTYVATALVAGLMEQPAVMAEIERMTPLKRLAEPQEVACAMLFLASQASSMVTGHILAVDGGYLAQ